MIRIRHETLPAGLSALVRRRGDGDLEVIVSTALSAVRQRAAVRAGLRAMQPATRRAGQIPVPALIALALAGSWLRAIGRLIRLHPAASIAVAATTAAATVAIAVVPHLHGPAVAGRNPAGAQLAPQRGSTAGPATPSLATPSASAVARPQPSAIPVAAHSPTGTTATPMSLPQQTPTGPAPTATPTPSASGGSSGVCLVLLGIWVCL